MPFVGESIVDGVLIRWFIQEGDSVTKGKILAEIETEKYNWEFESPCDGQVVTLHADEGDVIEVGQPIIDINTSDPTVKHMSVGKTRAKKDAAPAAEVLTG